MAAAAVALEARTGGSSVALVGIPTTTFELDVAGSCGGAVTLISTAVGSAGAPAAAVCGRGDEAARRAKQMRPTQRKLPPTTIATTTRATIAPVGKGSGVDVFRSS